MKKQKQTETVITAKALEAAMSHITEAREGMPFLTVLTDKERRAGTRISLKNLSLMEEAAQAVQQNKSILPAEVVEDYAANVALCRVFFDLSEKLRHLAADVADTLTIQGRNARVTTQQIRAIVRLLARNKPTPGIPALAQRLHPKGNRGSSSAGISATEPAAPVPALKPMPSKPLATVPAANAAGTGPAAAETAAGGAMTSSGLPPGGPTPGSPPPADTKAA